jgi:beta-lactamase superfamily II metal-dependent hydrolase
MTDVRETRDGESVGTSIGMSIGDPRRDPGRDPIIEISVVHSGYEGAEFPLIIGTFDREQISEPERFVDRQFHGQLSALAAVGEYPRRLGESVFIEPSDEEPTEPPGAYVVGLGVASELSRSAVADTVRRAVVRRCVALYPVRDDEIPTICDVGVSSTLLGIRNGDLLRIEDAVVGVVQGIMRANDELAEYERSRRLTGHTVRVGALQFVERYADRADLAVAALRSLTTSIPLSPGYGYLRSLVARTGPGSRPSGAELIESTRRYRRFLITEQPSVAGAEPDPAVLELDVAVIGGSARTDRIRHRLDRPMVDALLARLSDDRTDVTSAATLYDLLVPRELHDQFVTTTAVQFVVDDVTANYPWELVTVPRPSGTPSLGAAGGVIRQFVDDDAPRWLAGPADTSGGVLLIAAGKVPGFPELPGVYAETDAAQRRLGSLFGDVDRLDDDDEPFDLVELQNALFADHRVVHICGHGVYEDGRPDKTGVVLAPGRLLTALTVRQLRRVPELVVLNCCSLGRIGGSRLAAGLAREFMTAGARAVVAAGWPVTDTGALAFAGTMYDELVAGRQFGDAIARARLACQESDDSATWAAYQCYGDPSYVLHGGAASRATPFFAPVSSSDLVGRLQSLSAKISDLGRAGHGDVIARKTLLHSQWDELAAWADARREHADSPTVHRLLRSTLRDLGDLDAASARYAALCTPPDMRAVGPIAAAVRVAPGTTPEDVLDAAECMSRAAQQRARAHLASGSASAELDEVLGTLDLAEQLARLATAILMPGTAPPVIGEVLLRRATVDVEGRAGHLAAAAFELAKVIGDGTTLAAERLAQLAALRILAPADQEATDTVLHVAQGEGGHTDGAARPDQDLDRGFDRGSERHVERRVDQRVATAADFDERVLSAQRDLTAALQTDGSALCLARTRAACDGFQHAFEARSTWLQRASVLAHLDDLVDLMAPDDPRRPHLAGCRQRLAAWERRYVDGDTSPVVDPLQVGAVTSSTVEHASGRADDDASGVAVVPGAPVLVDGAGGADGADGASDDAVGDRGRRPVARPPATTTVQLTAFPAGCGDALLLEYDVRGRSHRVLVDGGLGSAYERGLGAHIERDHGGRLHVDVAVVTHVDLDHIEGVIDAVAAGALDADELWFNGLDEIDALLGRERGPKQGDELAALIPTDRRNTSVDGLALHLPDDDAPIRIELPGGARCTVLGPTRRRLQRLAAAWRRTHRGESGGDPSGDPVQDLFARLADDELRGDTGFGGDRSVANGSSIVLLVEIGDRALLLTGDAFAADLEHALRCELDARAVDRLEVDLFKLSHHGSRGNVTPELLELVAPRAVLVCTDGSKFEHPDADAIALVRQAYPDVPIHFTDATDLIRQRSADVGGIVPEDGPVRLRWS